MKHPTLVRAVGFECLHRYENPNWSPEKNREEFGACYTPHGHGHSYKMEAYVSGPIDPETGMVINLKDLDLALKPVVESVAGKHLNFEVPEFAERIPTTEMLAEFLFKKLHQQLSSLTVQLKRIRLYENDDLWVDVT